MKRTWYKIRFGLIKKIFIGLLTSLVDGSNRTKCVSLSNQKCMTQPTLAKVTCRVQIWKKKTFCQNSNYFGCSFIKNDILFMYFLCIYKKPVILSLFRLDILNFTLYILTTLLCPLKIYASRLHNQMLMNIFFTIDHKRS